MSYSIGKRGGLGNTRLYNIWCHMRSRCYRKSGDKYNYYGGRGIKVCDEWLSNFKIFYTWAMQNGYDENLTIDRIDPNGDYCPKNCRWVSHKEQCNNRRSNVVVVIDGISHNIREWSEITGIKYHTIYMRHKRGLVGRELIKEVI